jgi:hypothetical protein
LISNLLSKIGAIPVYTSERLVEFSNSLSSMNSISDLPMVSEYLLMKRKAPENQMEGKEINKHQKIETVLKVPFPVEHYILNLDQLIEHDFPVETIFLDDKKRKLPTHSVTETSNAATEAISNLIETLKSVVDEVPTTQTSNEKIIKVQNNSNDKIPLKKKCFRCKQMFEYEFKNVNNNLEYLFNSNCRYHPGKATKIGIYQYRFFINSRVKHFF